MELTITMTGFSAEPTEQEDADMLTLLNRVTHEIADGCLTGAKNIVTSSLRVEWNFS